jgi:NAD(P)-dependent dehydrogenase (short-subunit alcohol dehydrogenase family)
MPPRSRAAAAAASFPPVPANCVVTGGSGFVGQRLVEMLVERGAKRVVSFDIAPTPRDALQDARVVYQQGDLTKLDDVLKACEVRSRRLKLSLCRAALTLPARLRALTACGTSPRLSGRTTSTRRTTT